MPKPRLTLSHLENLLLRACDDLRECGHDPRNLALYGQEKMGTTWSI